MSLSREQAIALGESEFWKGMTYREIAVFQMLEERSCMPFSIFHEALEKTIGRPIFTHEFGLNFDGLKAELFNGKAPPTLEEIINLIPENKRVLIVAN